MYPFIRLTKEMIRASRMPPMALGDTHVSHHICWPWDLDFAMELNNGRTLSLLDLGRLPVFLRSGMFGASRQHKWGVAMAGVIVRYRKRVKVFQRVETHSRLVGWDDRFFYLEQSMWKTDGSCANHAVYRVAVTDAKGILAPARAAEILAIDPTSPQLPQWIEAWSTAERLRPWPPERANEAVAKAAHRPAA